MTTGPALYRSTDAGTSWEAVAGQPAAGMMPHHAVLDGCGNIYLAYNNGSGPNGVTAGAVWRYATATGAWTDVSPAHGGLRLRRTLGRRRPPGNAGGHDASITGRPQAEIYRTTNGGASWAVASQAGPVGRGGRRVALLAHRQLAGEGLDGRRARSIPSIRRTRCSSPGRASGRARRRHHGGQRGGHALDVRGRAASRRRWSLDLASPPTRSAPLAERVGDIGGFRHDALDASPAAGCSPIPIFGNTTSLDFAEGAPLIVARVGTSSSGGHDRRLVDRRRRELDAVRRRRRRRRERGLRSAGSIAVSADGNDLRLGAAR